MEWRSVSFLEVATFLMRDKLKLFNELLGYRTVPGRQVKMLGSDYFKVRVFDIINCWGRKIRHSGKCTT